MEVDQGMMYVPRFKNRYCSRVELRLGVGFQFYTCLMGNVLLISCYRSFAIMVRT